MTMPATSSTRSLIAIIRPANRPFQRVAEKTGLPFERAAVSRSGLPVHIHATLL